MFEQSILIDHARQRPWSFCASLSAEILVVSLLILIPLAYTDQLPDFHFRSVMTGPQVRPVRPQQVRAQPNGVAVRHGLASPLRVFDRASFRRDVPSSTQAPIELYAPGPPVSGDGFRGAVNPIVFEMPVVRPPGRHPAEQPTQSSGPIRVSQGVQMAKIIRQVIPVYPPLAKQTHTSGIVHLIGVIAKDGTIQNLQLLDGHPLLTQAAMDAVRQWVYKPTLLNGEPVEVICPIDVNFTLSQR